MRPITRIASLITLFALMLTLSIPFASAQNASLDAVIVSNASLRSGPGVDWRRLAQLDAGTPFRLDLRAPGGGWARGIDPAGQIGWVIYEALNLPVEQIDTLPSGWAETPFTLTAPAGVTAVETTSLEAPSADAPPADAPPAEAPAVPVVPVVNTAPTRGFAYGGHVGEFSEFAANAMRTSGMTWVKRQWRYMAGQSPDMVAGWINDAHARGFRILLGIVGEPGQLNNGGYFDQYAAFVGGVAAYGADGIEVWNEMNIDREWPAGLIDPAMYTTLLRVSYNAIKAANPGTLVISGAPAPTGYFGGCSINGCDDNFYIAGMAAAGAANYMDCLGIHYNEGILPPTATSGDPRGASSHYSRYFRAMINTYTNAFGTSRPLCFTELGYLTPEGYPPLPGAFGWAENTSLTEQASWLDQAISLSSQSGRVRLLIVWNIDFTVYDSDPQAGFAIIRPGGGCPACEALGS